MSLINTLINKFNAWQIAWRRQRSARKIKNFQAHDERLVQKLSAAKLPSTRQMKFLPKFLSRGEKTALRIFSGLLLLALACLALNLYFNYSRVAPAAGGSYTEGLVGAPQYINPLFAGANDVDLDLTSLIYSGLLKFTDNGLVGDLASDYWISEDQKTYTFKLREDALWHDGQRVTADDVLFTFERLQNSKSKSPLYFNLKGAKAEKIDDYSIKFTLAESFAPFLENLTMGILPEHLWSNIEPENMLLAEYNLKPIGSGPYKFKSLVKNKNGSLKSYHLERNENYYRGAPFIDELNFKFFDSFDQAVNALNNKNVEGISYLPKEIRERIINNRNINFNLLTLPQYTAIFFNYSSNPILKDVTIRKILSHGINKDKIVNEILNAEVRVIDSCILPDSLGFNQDIPKYPYDVAHAKSELEKAGWVLTDYVLPEITEDKAADTASTEENDAAENNADSGEQTENSPESATEEPAATAQEIYPFQVRKKGDHYLEFTLTTVNQPETVRVAKELQKGWQQIGAKVNLIIVEPKSIVETLNGRHYEALLYGQILGYDPDPYPFWHSSQTTYPGLNLTSFANKKADDLLETARKTSAAEERAQKYANFQQIIAEEVPAIFLYNPTYTYPQSKKIKGFSSSKIITPSDRFGDIADWYINTDREWLD